MRTREEIANQMKSWSERFSDTQTAQGFLGIAVELLLDIRDLLTPTKPE